MPAAPVAPGRLPANGVKDAPLPGAPPLPGTAPLPAEPPLADAPPPPGAPPLPDAPPSPGAPPLPGERWLAEEPDLADDAWLAGERWLAGDAGPLPPWPEGDPEWDDPTQVPAWLDRELARATPWLDDEPGWADPAPGPREVLKAGRWDRASGTGGGFAAGGAADRLPPGAVLAGLAGDRWADGLGRLSDDELIGVLIAARRLASWAAAMELAAVGELWQRRTAEEEAGDTGAAFHADDELAAALTLTRHAADKLLDLAVTLRRLPATAAALAAGDIDLPRAQVIADEVAGLSDTHAAAVDRAVTGDAPSQTTGQLRAATRTAVLAADPDAARKRKEQAQRQARVERWTEPAGTAALAGRDLPPAAVLAADANLTALATQLKAAGADGTMDTLRARIYLALLTGTPPSALLPSHDHTTTCQSRPGDHRPAGPSTGSTHATPGGNGHPPADPRPGDSGRAGDATTPAPNGPPSGGGRPADGAPTPSGSPRDRGGPVDGTAPTPCPSPTNGGCATHSGSPSDSSPPGNGSWPADGGWAGMAKAAGRVNLTVPLATWLGQADTPGHAAGYGPLDATDTRALAHALATHAGTTWCLTLVGPDGRPLAHGCGRGRPPGNLGRQSRDGPVDRPQPGSRHRSRPGSRDALPTGSRDGPEAGPPADGPDTASALDVPNAGSPPRAWTFTLTPLTGDGCDHAWETPAYRPTAALRHLAAIRHTTCVFPDCRRPAAQCDTDHTLAYHHGGRTCLCNLAPLCRHHHQAKQTRGWALDHTTPGTLTWTTPSGRHYTVQPSQYPA